MEELITQFGPKALSLLAIVPLLVQRLKKLPILVKLQGQGYPAFETTAISLGIIGAFAMSLANPIVVGVVAGLAGIGTYKVASPKK